MKAGKMIPYSQGSGPKATFGSGRNMFGAGRRSSEFTKRTGQSMAVIMSEQLTLASSWQALHEPTVHNHHLGVRARARPLGGDFCFIRSGFAFRLRTGANCEYAESKTCSFRCWVVKFYTPVMSSCRRTIKIVRWVGLLLWLGWLASPRRLGLAAVLHHNDVHLKQIFYDRELVVTFRRLAADEASESFRTVRDGKR